MDKRIAGLLGAAAAFTAVTAAQATTAPTPQLAPANSYRDLLDPIANPVPVLKAEEARRAERSANEVAQISVQLGHHHHHHHHHHGVVVRVRPHHPHHHHHHHHHHHQD